MWLLPASSFLSRLAARVYYRLTVSGPSPTPTGPLLLVANHPNSLLDPMLVAAAARRPVRFLAKAPLFTDRKVGWLVRGSGSIPVYRRVDDPGAVTGNVDMFRAVHTALWNGAAIGIFPEGISHNKPALSPLKTGAARIALGAQSQTGGIFPIVPIGIVPRQKDVFRSQALIVRGSPIEWQDLAERGAEDQEGVRELTARIESGLRKVTVNLEQWADAPLIECAEAIWHAETGADSDPASRVARAEVITTVLSNLRSQPDRAWQQLAQQVTAHNDELERLRLSPSSIKADIPLRSALRWTMARVYLIGLPALALVAVSYTIFRIPFYATGILANVEKHDPDRRSTYKLLTGIGVYGVWIVLLSAVVTWSVGWAAGVSSIAALPLIGVVGLWTRERWKGSWVDAKRFLLLRSRRALIQTIQQRQQDIASKLKELYDDAMT